MSLPQMSFAGAILILAIVVVRTLTINRLPKKTFLALWDVALLRLLIPFSLPSIFSAYSLVEKNTPIVDVARNTPVTNLFPVAPANQITALPTNLPNTATTFSLWVIIWIVGALACALFFSVSYLKCRREFQTSLPVNNDFIENWLNTHRLKRSISIRQSSRISAPLTYGILHPVILMPKTTHWTDIKSLQYILAHEHVHIKRFDTATKLALTVALCIHWFNPLVWAMYILANRDMELSCDEAVVRIFGEETKSAYARTLISMEEMKSGLTPLCNSFSKNATAERITSVMKIKKTSLLAIFVAVALVAGITIAFATSATSEDIPIQTEQPLNEHTVIMGDLTFSIYESKEDITTKLNEAGLGYDEYYLDDGDKKGNYDSRYAVGTSLQVYFLDDLCVRL